MIQWSELARELILLRLAQPELTTGFEMAALYYTIVHTKNIQA